jgi:hypothetical protein
MGSEKQKREAMNSLFMAVSGFLVEIDKAMATGKSRNVVTYDEFDYQYEKFSYLIPIDDYELEFFMEYRKSDG